MTYPIDLLGRPPIMRPIERPEDLGDVFTLPTIPRNPGKGVRAVKRSVAQPPRAPKLPRPVCAFEGCDARVGRNNTSGVCTNHMHRPVCRCKQCVARRE